MTGTRDITVTTAAAAAASTIRPVLFAKLELDSGNILVHSELGNIIFGGDTYTGVGTFGGISPADEVSDLSRTPISLTLSGIPNTMIAIVLGQYYQGRRATIYLGYLDLTTHVLVDTPVILYRGLIDSADIQQGESFSVTLSVESRFAQWETPLVRRYNNADQQSRYPADRGFEFAEQATEKTINWGSAG